MTGAEQLNTACNPAPGESQKHSSMGSLNTRSPMSEKPGNGVASTSCESWGSMTAQTKQKPLPDEVVEFIEKAAIREYMGEMPRANAESMALQEISKKYGKAAAKACDEWRKAND